MGRAYIGPGRVWAHPYWGHGFWGWRGGAWVWLGGPWYVSPDYPGWLSIGTSGSGTAIQWVWQDGYWTPSN